MTEPDFQAAVDALAAVYGNVTAVADGLGDAELMTATRCAGWVAGDLLYHQLLDARRALRSFATPAAGPADTDDVSYWRPYSSPLRATCWLPPISSRRWPSRRPSITSGNDRPALGTLADQFPVFG